MFFAKISINFKNITDYAGENTNQRNFREGMRLVSSNHIIKCGKSTSNNDSKVKIIGLCLTSVVREKSHEITGEFSSLDGKIASFVCSCTAGESGKCKHILRTLFYCLM